MRDALELLLKHRVIPVVEISDSADAAGLAAALADGGLPVVEVTLRTSAAVDAIARIRAAVPEMAIGAGTVLDAAAAEAAAGAGADFLVAPGYSPAVGRRAAELGIPLIPGAATASEVENTRADGFRTLKFFPAVPAGGIPLLTALTAPYRDVRFMPTGGIRQETLADWLAVPAVAACGGTWIAPAELIERGDWDAIRTRATDAVRAAAPQTTHE